MSAPHRIAARGHCLNCGAMPGGEAMRLPCPLAFVAEPVSERAPTTEEMAHARDVAKGIKDGAYDGYDDDRIITQDIGPALDAALREADRLRSIVDTSLGSSGQKEGGGR